MLATLRHVRARSIRSLVVSTLVALVAACGGGGDGDVLGPPGGQGNEGGDPGVPGVYDLTSVNGNDVPFTMVNTKIGNTQIRGEITSGTLTIRADGTYSSSMRGRWWTNGQLTSDRVSEGNGTWSFAGDEVTFTPAGSDVSVGTAPQPYTMDRYSWNALMHMRRVVENGVDATWPYLYMRR